MGTLKVIALGDERGVGSVVEETTFFGKKKSWTLVPGRELPDRGDDPWRHDRWVCLQTGEDGYRQGFGREIDNVYNACYLTQHSTGK